MIDHVGVQVADVQASVDFYLRCFSPIGVHEAARFPAGDTGVGLADRDGIVVGLAGRDGIVVGLAGRDGIPKFWLSPAFGTEARELHVAFRAADRAEVEAVHTAALDAGAEVLTAPREFPEYHPGYFGVFLRDLDGHNVEAVHHGH